MSKMIESEEKKSLSNTILRTSKLRVATTCKLLCETKILRILGLIRNIFLESSVQLRISKLISLHCQQSCLSSEETKRAATGAWHESWSSDKGLY